MTPERKARINKPMMKRVKGDLNQIAYLRRGKQSMTDGLGDENFEEGYKHLKRKGVVAGKLKKRKGGVATYVYG